MVVKYTINEPPNSFYYFLSRGHEYYNQGQYQEAIDNYTKAIQLNSTYIDAYLYRGHCYIELNQFQRTIDDYTRAVHLDSNYIEAYRVRASFYDQLGRYQEAIDDYTRLIRLESYDDPYMEDGERSYYIRGCVYEKLGRYQEAIDDYKKALQLDVIWINNQTNDPNYDNANNSVNDPNIGLISNCRKHLNRLTITLLNARSKDYLLQAIDNFQFLQNFFTTFYEIHNNLGVCYRRNGDLQKALESLNKAVRLNHNSYTHNNRGLVYQELGFFGKAETEFREAVRLDPTNVKVRNNLEALEQKIEKLEGEDKEKYLLELYNEDEVDKNYEEKDYEVPDECDFYYDSGIVGDSEYLDYLEDNSHVDSYDPDTWNDYGFLNDLSSYED